MPTLKEILYWEKDDMKAIRTYFIENDLMAEATEMLMSLQEHRIKELQWSVGYSRMWAGSHQIKYLFDNYPKDVADLLANFEVYVMVNCTRPEWLETFPTVPKVSDLWLERLREVVPQYTAPKLYFAPALETLKANGIYFKEEHNDN